MRQNGSAYALAGHSTDGSEDGIYQAGVDGGEVFRRLRKRMKESRSDA
jgi:hypothetical protein